VKCHRGGKAQPGGVARGGFMSRHCWPHMRLHDRMAGRTTLIIEPPLSTVWDHPGVASTGNRPVARYVHSLQGRGHGRHCDRIAQVGS
jgi:hypothetical protein